MCVVFLLFNIAPCSSVLFPVMGAVMCHCCYSCNFSEFRNWVEMKFLVSKLQKKKSELYFVVWIFLFCLPFFVIACFFCLILFASWVGIYIHSSDWPQTHDPLAFASRGLVCPSRVAKSKIYLHEEWQIFLNKWCSPPLTRKLLRKLSLFQTTPFLDQL